MAARKPSLEDDGLTTPEIGAWSADKHRLIAYYARMFATGMKTRWECRVYIDLFAGCGRARIENSGRIVPGSPILSLDIPDKFDRYIFCELDTNNINVLQRRVAKAFPQIDARYIAGDVNTSTAMILREIPSHSKSYRVLTFCVADPFNISNLAFTTIKDLAQRFVDFLVLIPSYMDANRNQDVYLHPRNTILDRYFGTSGWRRRWSSCSSKFASFVVDYFGERMKELGYEYNGTQSTKLIRGTEKNIPLYHIAFYSRNKIGMKFWNEAVKYSDDQMELFDRADYEPTT